MRAAFLMEGTDEQLNNTSIRLSDTLSRKQYKNIVRYRIVVIIVPQDVHALARTHAISHRIAIPVCQNLMIYHDRVYSIKQCKHGFCRKNVLAEVEEDRSRSRYRWWDSRRGLWRFHALSNAGCEKGVYELFYLLSY